MGGETGEERRDGRDEREEGSGGKSREGEGKREREREREREKRHVVSHTTSSLVEQANQFTSPHRGKTKREKDRVNEPMLGTS